jgi:lauroyl/myristoyl acyltransferase
MEIRAPMESIIRGYPGQYFWMHNIQRDCRRKEVMA